MPCVVHAWKCQRVFSVCWESSRPVYLLLNTFKSNANVNGIHFTKIMSCTTTPAQRSYRDWRSHWCHLLNSLCDLVKLTSNQTRATEQGSHMVVKMQWMVKKKLEQLLDKLHQDRQISFKFFLMSRRKKEPVDIWELNLTQSVCFGNSSLWCPLDYFHIPRQWSPILLFGFWGKH